jgi:hypothetical protein
MPATLPASGPVSQHLQDFQWASRRWCGRELGRDIHRLGYLSEQEFAYTLACYCWLRHEPDPAWAVLLDPGPRAYLHQGLAYLASAGSAGELPTERLLGKVVKCGKTTIRIVPVPSGTAITARAVAPGPAQCGIDVLLGVSRQAVSQVLAS